MLGAIVVDGAAPARRRRRRRAAARLRPDRRGRGLLRSLPARPRRRAAWPAARPAGPVGQCGVTEMHGPNGRARGLGDAGDVLVVARARLVHRARAARPRARRGRAGAHRAARVTATSATAASAGEVRRHRGAGAASTRCGAMGARRAAAEAVLVGGAQMFASRGGSARHRRAQRARRCASARSAPASRCVAAHDRRHGGRTIRVYVGSRQRHRAGRPAAAEIELLARARGGGMSGDVLSNDADRGAGRGGASRAGCPSEEPPAAAARERVRDDRLHAPEQVRDRTSSAGCERAHEAFCRTASQRLSAELLTCRSSSRCWASTS